MKKIIIVLILGVIIISIYDKSGNALDVVYDASGNPLGSAYDKDGELIYPDAIPVPIPSGNLIASETVQLPDIHNTGHGWTCTGLCYDSASDTFLVGDFGETLPSAGNFATQIVRVEPDFETVIETIPLYTEFPNIQGVQGVTIDTSDGTIWFCSPREGKVRNIDVEGNSIKSFNMSGVTGIAYSRKDDCFWILVLNTNDILKVSKSGTVQSRYAFDYNEPLDQCFLDEHRNLLYMTAGTNYSGRNNVYCFNTVTHEQSIACTVDSYSVEGIWLGDTNKMIILNDGYYHSAAVPHNQANIYTIE